MSMHRGRRDGRGRPAPGRVSYYPASAARRALLVLLSAAAVLPAFSGGCRQAESAPPPPPPAVTVAQPVEREVVEWDEYTGRLEASEMVEVRARVSGFIDSVHFADGGDVKQGDLLFVIDPRPYQTALDQAKADVARAQAQVDRATAEVARLEKLRAASAASDKEYLDERYNQQSAQAQRAAAEAAVRMAELNLEFTRVTAPISGRIGRKLVTPGNLINGGAGQATLLTTIAATDPIYCYVDADERAILKYQRLSREHKRQSARETRIPAYMGLADEGERFPHEGYIDFVNNRLDPATGTLQARATFVNPGGDRFTPGLFARLRVPGSGRYHATLVADEAIGTDQGQKFVIVVGPDNVAQYRRVQTGALFNGLRVVEGVKADEWVVVNGLMNARPGMPVNPTKAQMPAGAGGAPIPPTDLLGVPTSQPVETQPAATQPVPNASAGAGSIWVTGNPPPPPPAAAVTASDREEVAQ